MVLARTRKPSKKGFKKLKPNANTDGTNSYNYALMVEDLRDGVNFEQGKQHLLYWSKGTGERVYDHLVTAAIYNHLNNKFPGKFGKPTPLLYEVLSYFMAYPEYYKIGFIRFNNGLSDESARKYEAVLIQMKHGIKQTINPVRLLNTQEPLKTNGITNLNRDEIKAIIQQAFKRKNGFNNNAPTFVNQEDIEKVPQFKKVMNKIKKMKLDEHQLNKLKKGKTVPFSWIQQILETSVSLTTCR